MRKMFQDPRSFAAKEKSTSMLQNENPLYKCFTHYQSDLYKGQLHPGEQFDFFQGKILRHIDDSLQWDHLSSGPGATSTINRIIPHERTLSLSDWCREVIVKAPQEPFSETRSWISIPISSNTSTTLTMRAGSLRISFRVSYPRMHMLSRLRSWMLW